MLISLDYLIEKYKLNLTGILHIGAHNCQELKKYIKFINIRNILWIEGNEEKVIRNKNKYKNILIEHAVVSDVEEEINFNICSNDQCSSIFDLGLHKKYYPNIKVSKTISVKTSLLCNIIKKYNINFNFINLDIQGAELKALKGMDNYLINIDYIYTEVNSDYVYLNCNLINEIDDYLHKFDFVRVETSWYKDHNWGDAFYIKNKLLNNEN